MQNNTVLHEVVLAGNISAVQQNASQFAKMFNGDDKTALMIAAEKNFVEAVRELRQHEARLQNGAGKTALMYACENRSYEAIRELADYELQLLANDGTTPLMALCSSADKEQLALEDQDPFQEEVETTLTASSVESSK